TQPGAAANTLANGNNAVLLIELNGGNARTVGLTIFGSSTVIRGLAVNQFTQSGISITGDNNVLEGNYVGTDATGLLDLGNGTGISINATSANNVIGSADPADRNVISGNTEGIALWGSGVDIFTPGITGTLIQGNYIGTGSDALTALTNTSGGIVVRNFASSNTIGGSNAGEGNLIANHTTGITMFSGYQNAIVGNRFYNNTTAYSLSLVGANDAGDPDTSVGVQRVNMGQNFPVLSSATVSAGDLIVNYSIDSTVVNSAYPIAIDFYRAQNASNNQGLYYLGRTTIAAPGSSSANLGNAFALGVGGGHPIVATATDANGNSSLFSSVVIATGTSLYVVNSTGDGVDANLGNGICETATLGECTLRAALQEANASAGTNTIYFNIPGLGVHTIAPGSALPTVNEAVTIDGTTQPGASCAAWPPTLLVELNGAGVGLSNGINLSPFSGDGSTIRGLVINRFGGNGIDGAFSSNVHVECNFIGTNAAGTTAAGFGNSIGIMFQQGSSGNVIGGPADSQRNLIAGNTGNYQVVFSNFGIAPTNNTVQNNYIGTDVTGMSALGGGSFAGVSFGGSTNNQILDNLISGNTGYGIYVFGNNTGPSNNNVIQGNWIGVDSTGTGPLGNGAPGVPNGISMVSSQNDVIGGTGPGEANIVANSFAAGITISTFSGADPRVSIRGNSIYNNGGLGIEIFGILGQESNDPLDGDTGPNNLQNYPVLTAATVAGNLTIDFSVDSQVGNSAYPVTVDFYEADSAGSGEGQTYLGGTLLMGPGSTSTNLGPAGPLGVAVGDPVVATVTDANGNTSEFSTVILTTAGSTITVNNMTDGVDANIGNGLCETSTPGQCTLRAAIQEANALPGTQTITLPAGIINLSLAGSGENASATGDLDITDALIIQGASGPVASWINASGLDRVFDVSGANVTFDNVVMSGGSANYGAGIYAHASATVTLNQVKINSNAASLGGGGMRLETNASATIVDSQFFGNSSGQFGAALDAVSATY
ncbi:MAG TPA: CSLREA domain-containing protein, partial [Anaerolineales bacterium]|nr:CSLREA domain-containing protein [Anaerolineales bacterium]